MNKKKLNELRQAFEAKRDELQTAIDNHNKTEVDVDGDSVDHIQGSQLINVYSELSKRNLSHINKINIALKKIENGSFGECEQCSEDITDKRLLANPLAITCIFCAEKLEKIAKSYTK